MTDIKFNIQNAIFSFKKVVIYLKIRLLLDTENKKLQQKWSVPDSIVRKHIELMPVKSPDIIKPILES